LHANFPAHDLRFPSGPRAKNKFRRRILLEDVSAYGNGKDGTFSLADARRERDKAKDLLKEGKDSSTEKAAARPFD
jgi:hypothetical protein